MSVKDKETSETILASLENMSDKENAIVDDESVGSETIQSYDTFSKTSQESMFENAIVDDESVGSETIQSYNTFSETSQETMFNRFENDGFIMFETIQDESVGTKDSFSLASPETSESNLSGNFNVDKNEEEECESECEGKTF